ncbi:GNAT family N-acetyltransferase [Bordetella pseudohinzii]|uniref:Acetyltransferase n=1 Tax=Bordetella pseudohinzii TaxID=1331258 RepID=A0A0J6BW37_9BORD|nr:GNAT family N-acetyltransferase [Bordetella pseudohinzii]ANY14958.1 acetyltransferase [Bordetella pseudohinzii]KMM25989.1 acetyltransferase [Bordetella pseudohinzii]KXA78816.1 acetyltransferase [Bordetella pseudohinzii]KXA79247.1 acetyltransferase [Bordetella pseudohinzii]CUI95502.1 Predicted acetyltransferase involved in intracellular survival and related acetyltransferases [Bordetella pseudohinzii]
MPHALRCRPLAADDLPLILRLQAAVYPEDLLETADFFLNRLELASATCRVALRGGSLVGYLVAYPWRSGLPPALNLPLQALPADADSWFVHDCAVAPQAQGAGVAGLMLRDSARAAARAGLTRASLVSLAPAVRYWTKLGYVPATPSAPLAAKLAGYGAGAVYMARDIPFQ